MANMTDTQQEIDRQVREATGLSLAEWIERQRPRGWDAISLRLARISTTAVNGETLRRWYSEREHA